MNARTSTSAEPDTDTDQIEGSLNTDDESEVEATASPPAEPAEPGEPGETGRRRSWAQWALLGLALVVAVSGLVAWSQASGDETISKAETRDVVLLTAREHIKVLNSLDYQDVDGGLKAWTDVTTGTLNDQLSQIDSEAKKLLSEQKKISTGKVVDAAVVSLDGASATVIAAVEITVQDAAKSDAEPVVKRNRFSADLVKVKGEWKLENLQQVAVNLS